MNQVVPSDKLVHAQKVAAEARDLELHLEQLNESIKETKEKLNLLYSTTLPDLFDDLGIDNLGVPSKDNNPGMDFELKPYYSAGIAAKWPEEKKKEAFALLKRCKAESLIKTEVAAALPKGNLAAAKKIFASIKKLKIKGAALTLEQTVHKSTLTAWLRELYERGQSLPQSDLEKIAGSVGRVVRPKGREKE